MNKGSSDIEIVFLVICRLNCWHEISRMAGISGEKHPYEIFVTPRHEFNDGVCLGIGQSRVYGSALVIVVVGGQTEIVKFLVEKGADVNVQLQSGDYGSALVATAEGGNPEVIKYLLVADAIVNQYVRIGRYGNALAVVAY
jgi:hypothetical protein